MRTEDKAPAPCAPREHMNDLDNPGFCVWCGVPMLSRQRDCRTQPEREEPPILGSDLKGIRF